MKLRNGNQQNLGSAFTDWRNSVENQLTNLIGGSLTPSGTAKPIVTTPAPVTIAGMSATTIGIIGLGAALVWKLMHRR